MHIYINNIGLFFHGKTSVPSVEMVDALARYTSNYKFQIKSSLKKENGKFQKIINVFLVIYKQMHISYAFQCEIYIRLSNLRCS